MPLDPSLVASPVLICVAAPKEAEAVWCGLAGPSPPSVTFDARSPWRTLPASDRFELLQTHVGKANAAAALATVLAERRHHAVINLGVAGALPGSGLILGDVVVATESFYADEGLDTPDGFVDVASMGFPPGVPDRAAKSIADEVFRVLAAGLAKPAPVRGAVATVSTCAGTDSRADSVAARTGALAEAMEGAALASTLERSARPIPFCEVRVISNTTGDRDRQRWDLAAALDRLREAASVL